MGKCLFIDGNNVVFRAYYAFERQHLKTRSGKPSGAIFGFTRLLLKLLEDHKPDFAAVAFDVSRDTFRKEIYPEYKANRKPTPDELLEQFPAARAVVSHLGIKLMQNPLYEADDLIGSACEMFKHDHKIVIVTGDRDLLQLIDENVTVELCRKGVSETAIFDKAAFCGEYQFPPPGIVDLKALMGDASDNIPGVRGIGEKKGLALVREFGDIDSLFSSVDKIANPKLREMVISGRESAYLSKKLALIRRDLDIGECCDEFRWSRVKLNNPDLCKFLEEWNFKSILETIRTEHGIESVETAEVYDIPIQGNDLHVAEPVFQAVPGEKLIITSSAELEKYLTSLPEEVCIDIETDGLEPSVDRIVGIALAGDTDRAIYLPLRHSYPGLDPSDQMNPSECLRLISSYLHKKTLVGHNLKFDLSFLEYAGYKHSGNIFDTMLAAYVCDPTMQNGLKYLARELLNLEVTDFRQVAGSGSFDRVDLPSASEYACQDVLITLMLKRLFEDRLNTSGQMSLFAELEIPLLPILLEMETTGIGINLAYLENLALDFEKRLIELEHSIHSHAGCVFNLNSSKQLQEVLFEKLGLEPPRKTKTGFSTDSEVLRSLAYENPICNELLKYREISKLKSTYVDSLGKLVDPESGIIHTSFNQTVTATGRLSSSNPNLQNIPVKTELGRSVRRAFIPPVPDEIFLSLDYSQIELRLLAHFSQDPALMDAFKNSLDIHTLTASRLFGKQPEEITPNERKIGKTVNFGIIYGISAHGLAQDLGITRPIAQKYIDGFFAGFPGVIDYFERNLDEARKTGTVTTLLGRSRPIPELASAKHTHRAFAERTVRNTPLQGSAADLVKKAMIDCSKILSRLGSGTRMILQIHDELVFSVPIEEMDFIKPQLKNAMEQTVELNVPLVCDAASGPNLADLE